MHKCHYYQQTITTYNHNDKFAMSREKISVSDAKDLVCVTGANGFLGSYIVKELLERGYRVRGTVRSTKDPKKTQHLLALPGADKLLELVEADLSVENCFDDAFKDCKYVIHNASPFTFKYKDPKRDMVDPAVNGTLSAMSAALKNHVTRIVVTSSINAITDQPVKRYTEEDWNTLSSYKRNAYHYSKVMAERAAWEFVEQHAQDPQCPELVTILPGGIIGAPLSVQGLENPSNEVVAQLFDGKIPGIIDFGLSMVDVNDVALAHVLAMITPEAKGQRYICTNHTVSVKDLAEHFRPKYTKAKIPTRDLSGRHMTRILRFFMGLSSDPQNQFLHYMIGRTFDFDTSKIQMQLGIKFRDVWPELDKVAEMLIENNMIKSVKKN